LDFNAFVGVPIPDFVCRCLEFISKLTFKGFLGSILRHFFQQAFNIGIGLVVTRAFVFVVSLKTAIVACFKVLGFVVGYSPCFMVSDIFWLVVVIFELIAIFGICSVRKYTYSPLYNAEIAVSF
jgi:uncharacterized membrane protein